MRYVMAVLIVLIPLSIFAAKAQCPRYSVSMEGTVLRPHGCTYTERLEAHKVSGGPGYNGRWKVDLFEQINTYSWNIDTVPIPPTDDVHDIGGGIRMRSQCAIVASNVLRCRSTSDNMYLEVKNNLVRMERTAPWNGKVAGNTMTWQFQRSENVPLLRGTIAEGPKEPIELTIIEPQAQGRYLYDLETPSGLTIKLKAKTKPEEYAHSVEWTVPEIVGSVRKTPPDQVTGGEVELLYENLPADNNQFGRKKVTATLKVGSCTVTEIREIILFYPRDGKNNPEGKYYNWFYYWKQTPAARPHGQNINIEYGGTEFDVCRDIHVPAMYKQGYLYKGIHVCDLKAKLGNKFSNRFPVIDRGDPATLTTKHYRTTTHIDTFASLVRHEFVHFQAYHNWRHGKTPGQIASEDQDGDGIPDHLEPAMGFDPAKTLTYWGDDPEWKKIEYDEELLAYEEMNRHIDGAYDAYDWGRPGKNWKE